jgi:transcriptional regulator with XRE-family HTH domain
VERHVLNTIDPATIGSRVADARRERRLTPRQAGDALGVARTTITAMEKGERRSRAAELIKLAQLYGRAVSEFVQPEQRQSLPRGFLVQFRAVGGRRGVDDQKRDGYPPL